MTRYFMGGTRLESLERLMMDPTRSTHSPPPDSQRQNGHYPKNGQAGAKQPYERDEGGGK